MTVQNGNTCFEMVRKGLGYGLFLSTDFFSSHPGLYKLPMTYENGEPVIRKQYMIYRQDICKINAINSFIQFTADYFSNLQKLNP